VSSFNIDAVEGIKSELFMHRS